MAVCCYLTQYLLLNLFLGFKSFLFSFDIMGLSVRIPPLEASAIL